MLALTVSVLTSPLPAQLVRVEPTTLALPADLPVTSGYVLENAFGRITFNQPLAVTTPPGETDRVFIVEKPGTIQIVTFGPGTGAPTKLATPFLDVRNISGVGTGTGTNFLQDGESGLLGLAFHPAYATNRTFFIFYTLNVGGLRHQRVARLQTSATNPNLADVATHAPLLTQRDEASNHNGGDLQFGPDDYLYVAVGDEGNANDSLNNSRWLNRDFFSGILRLDVNRLNVGQPGGSVEPNAHPAINLDPANGNRARYAIPPDNPLLAAGILGTLGPLGTGAYQTNGVLLNLPAASLRTEFALYGLRNPWRMSFDRPTGRLFIADVGQGAREEINLVTSLGRSFGWPFREGAIAFSSAPSPVPAAATYPRQEPIHDYDRTVGSSITGGIVYRGTRLTELFEDYVFADYGSGRVFALRHSGATWTRRTLVNSGASIAGIGPDPRNGDSLFANINTGVVQRLARSGTTGTAPPATLSATGAFANLATLAPAAGVVPYEINHPFWSDHALKRRWFAPPRSVASVATATYAAEGAWTFPTGMVWVKHFDLESTRGDPATARRLETRFIVKTATGAYGLSYRWRADQSDADLVAEEGADVDYSVVVNGLSQTQRWRFPSRNECRTCHTPAAGHALSFNTRQLNRPRTYGSLSDNQLNHLASAGYLASSTHPTRDAVAALPAHAALNDTTQSLEHRVRSYLAVNCVSCHVPGGAALGNFDVTGALATAATGLRTAALVNNGGDAANRLFAPADAGHSMILKRILGDGAPRMPPLATNEIDRGAETLLRAYIAELATRPTFAEWQATNFASAGAPAAAATADPDGDGASNRLEYLAGTPPNTAGADPLAVALSVEAGDFVLDFRHPAGRDAIIETSTDLSAWTRWSAPGNTAPRWPAADILRELRAPQDAPRRFFRVRLEER
jgi:glucose/arabinose dehydrogenase